MRKVFFLFFLFLAVSIDACQVQAETYPLGTPLAGGVKVQNEQHSGERQLTPPQQIYIRDFSLAANSSKTNVQPAEHHLMLQRPVLHQKSDPVQHAHQIVVLMSESIVREITKSGITALRLMPGMPMPSDGWIVEGVFTEVDEGNRLKRAVIGFGSGATHMEVQISISDLAKTPYAPFIIFGTVKDPKLMPGAVVTLNPYVAAAKFMVGKNASEKDIQQTAKLIANEIIKYQSTLKQQNTPPQVQ